jgi:hypothetical protein
VLVEAAVASEASAGGVVEAAGDAGRAAGRAWSSRVHCWRGVPRWTVDGETIGEIDKAALNIHRISPYSRM